MAELAIETTEVEAPVEKTSRYKTFTVNHPRTAKVVGIAAITAATFGAMAMWKARQEKNASTEDDTEDVPFDASVETN